MRPKTFFAIKYYIIEIKNPLKNNYFKQKKSFESKINVFEDKKLPFWLHFPPLVKLSCGLPLVPFSLRLGHLCLFVKSKMFCIANKNYYSETKKKKLQSNITQPRSKLYAFKLKIIIFLLRVVKGK